MKCDCIRMSIKVIHVYHNCFVCANRKAPDLPRLSVPNERSDAMPCFNPRPALESIPAFGRCWKMLNVTRTACAAVIARVRLNNKKEDLCIAKTPGYHFNLDGVKAFHPHYHQHQNPARYRGTLFQPWGGELFFIRTPPTMFLLSTTEICLQESLYRPGRIIYPAFRHCHGRQTAHELDITRNEVLVVVCHILQNSEGHDSAVKLVAHCSCDESFLVPVVHQFASVKSFIFEMAFFRAVTASIMNR